MLCPKCGTEISDEARACTKCGFGFYLNPQALPATDVAKDIPQQEKQVRRIMASVVVLITGAILAVMAILTSRRNETPSNQTSMAPDMLVSQPLAAVVTDSFVVKPNNYAAYEFAIPPGCLTPYLHGSWQVASGDASKAEILVLNDQNFRNWKGHLRCTASYFNRMYRNSLAIRVPDHPGRYFLVFSNRNSQIPLGIVNPNLQRSCAR